MMWRPIKTRPEHGRWYIIANLSKAIFAQAQHGRDGGVTTWRWLGARGTPPPVLDHSEYTHWMPAESVKWTGLDLHPKAKGHLVRVFVRGEWRQAVLPMVPT